MAGARERARVATTAEILRLARAQMEAEGPASLSLRAIARELGMVSSALYRYFPSRDELLTALIIESYDRLGEALERADAGVRARHDFRRRWRVVTGALRDFAIAHPSEWALLFGTPVPGYAAPQDTIGPASRYTLVMVSILTDMAAAGHRHDATVPKAMRADLTRLRTTLSTDASDGTLVVGLTAWAAAMGAVNLELFGHLHNVIDQPGSLFDCVVEQHGRIILGTESGTT
ncbi:MAG: TetR/AcrR family transcriptional regulator [Ilumatobacteraceae bacterium]